MKQQAPNKFNNSVAIETISMAIQNCSDFFETEIQSLSFSSFLFF